MLIHHDALVLVADGKKYLLLRNLGPFSKPELMFEGGGEHENPSTREQGVDQPGRTFASAGGGRSAVEQTDFHQLEKDRFAADIAGMVARLHRAGDFSELVVVAPPRTLAELRRHFEKDVADMIVAEIPKDLCKHSVSEIGAILAAE